MTTVHVFDADDFASLDAVATAELIRSGAASAAEVSRAALARVATADERLNAVVGPLLPANPYPIDPAAPFAGVPIVLKDNEAWPGTVTGFGSPAVRSGPATRPSPIASDLSRLGFDVIAKSTLPEFGLTASTESQQCGATHNPWRLGRSIGGSSGGSAALVAAGAVPLAHANDGGGSIRIPASCGGLVGLKVSRGRLADAEGTEALPIPVVVEGFVTRSVRDTAAALSALELLRPNHDLPPIGLVEGPQSPRLRIGVHTDDLLGLHPDEATIAAVHGTALTLESLGHEVELIDAPVPEQIGSDFLLYWMLMAWALRRAGSRLFGGEFDPDRLGPFTNHLADGLGTLAPKVPGSLLRLRRWMKDPRPWGEDHDIILSPVLRHVPPPLGYLSDDADSHDHLIRLVRFAGYTAWGSAKGTPAISLPAGLGRSGLPIGAQLSARMGQERQLLGLAHELQEAAPWSYPGLP